MAAILPAMQFSPTSRAKGSEAGQNAEQAVGSQNELKMQGTTTQ